MANSFGSPFMQKPAAQSTPSAPQTQQSPAFVQTVPDGQYSEYNTLAGRLPTPHKPAVNLTTSVPNIKTPPCTAAFNNCMCPQSVAWQFDYRNCPPKSFNLPQNCEIRPYPPNYRVYDLNELIFERSRTLNSNWNPYHFWNNQQAIAQFRAADLVLNNDPNLKPMSFHRPVTQYCFGCQAQQAGAPVIVPPRYLSF